MDPNKNILILENAATLKDFSEPSQWFQAPLYLFLMNKW